MAKSGQTREQCIADIQQGIETGTYECPNLSVSASPDGYSVSDDASSRSILKANARPNPC